MKKLNYYQSLDVQDELSRRMFTGIYQQLKVHNGAKILDMGCGPGRVGIFLPADLKNITLVGWDNDEIAKKNLKRNYRRIVVRDIEEENYKLRDFDNNYFDFIIAKDFLEHLLKPWKLIPEFSRVLKKGGKVYALVPNYTSSQAWIDYTHVRPFTKRSLKLMFEDFGFTAEEVSFLGFGPLSHKFFSRRLVNIPLFNRFAGGIEIIAIK